MSATNASTLTELVNPAPPDPWNPATWLHWPLEDYQQKPAYLDPGPSMILGGSGTGKTHVLLGRAVHLARSGVDPATIVIIASHAWAAQDMRARLLPVIGCDPADVDLYVGTLQDFCLTKLLRPYAVSIPTLPESFSLWTRGQSLAALAHIAGSDPQSRTDRRRYEDMTPILEWISGNAHLSPEHRTPPPRDEWHGYAASYQREKRAQDSLDRADLLVATRDALLENADMRTICTAVLTRHLLVDNFEDVGALQYELIRLMTGPEESVCVAMDPNQSVRRWGSVLPNPYDRFTAHYGEDITCLLPVNHRTSSSIMRSWHSLAKHPAMTALSDDHQRELRPENRRPALIAVDGRPQDQYRRIANDVNRLVDEGTFDPDQIAILARRRSSLLRISPHLEAVGVPFTAIGDFVGISDPEIQPVLAMLTLAVNPKNTWAFRRAGDRAPIGFHRSLSPRIIREIRSAAGRLDNDLVKAATHVRADLPSDSTAHEELSHIIELYQELQRMLAMPDASVAAMLALVHQRLHRPDADRKPPPSDDMARLMTRAIDRDTSARAMAIFRADEEGEQASMNARTTLLELLDQTADGIGVARLSEEEAPPNRWASRQRPPPGLRRVSLATIDMSKGMEWLAVIVADAADHIIPGDGADVDPAMMTVEQRLFYSAVSRAADWYALYWSQQRDNGTEAVPCRFIQFLPE